MLSPEEIEIYDRQLRLAEVGIDGQKKLTNANVLVVGAGGLGCPVLLYLAAAGVGNISVIDGDNVSLSNLQRQILFNQNDIGKNKAIVAAQKISIQNNYVKVNAIQEYCSKTFALANFKKYDLIIDCTDNYGTRYLVNDVCVLLGIPFISAALYKFEGQIGIYNVNKGNNEYSANYRDVFPDTEQNSASLNCSEIGVIASLPGLIGMYQANEAIKYFVSPSKSSIDKVLFIHAWNLSHRIFNFDGNSSKINIEEINNRNYEVPVCEVSEIVVIDKTELSLLLNNQTLVFLDVREESELPRFSWHNLINIPMSVLEKRFIDLKPHNTIVTVCKSGQRSKRAASHIKKQFGNKNILSYKFGIEQLYNDLKNMEVKI